MATYEDLKKANESIKTTEIKGKAYAEVNQRIKAFRMVYPEGYIKTFVLSNENGVCVIRAEVGTYILVDDGRMTVNHELLLGTGTAYENESSSFINKTSYIENCETSAVGRALGMAGFGIDISVASAEEVTNAIANQQITETQVKSLRLTIKNNPDKLGEEALLKRYKVKKLEELTNANLSEIIQYINKEVEG